MEDRCHLSLQMVQELARRLNENPEYRHNARALKCSMIIYEGDNAYNMTFEHGEISVRSGEPHTESDLRLGGVSARWGAVFSLPGRCGFYDAIHGEDHLSCSGNLLTVASNAKAFRDLWRQIRLMHVSKVGM